MSRTVAQKLREVHTGAVIREGEIEILDGVQPGEEVVVYGQKDVPGERFGQRRLAQWTHRSDVDIPKAGSSSDNLRLCEGQVSSDMLSKIASVYKSSFNSQRALPAASSAHCLLIAVSPWEHCWLVHIGGWALAAARDQSRFSWGPYSVVGCFDFEVLAGACGGSAATLAMG